MPRWIGPYCIDKMAGPMVVKLSLPLEMRIHPVFHVSLLKPYKRDGRTPHPPAFTIQGNEYWMEGEVVLPLVQPHSPAAAAALRAAAASARRAPEVMPTLAHA
jgi:hypothetical protein